MVGEEIPPSPVCLDLAVVVIIIILGVILSVAFITLFERKFMGAIQRRTGPTKVGYLGILQPIMDGIKLILKESIFPTTANIWLFLLAPFLVFYLALLNWLFIPLGSDFVISESPGGILILIALAELAIFGVLYAGWSANSKYPLIGSVRSTAQMISYSITLSLIFIALVLASGDISMMSFMLWSKWKILLPVIPIFIISALAETNRAPFDLPEAESELVAGFFTEHSAIGFVYFFLGEYTSILTICTLSGIFFFCNYAFGFALLIIFLWIRAVLPRYRFDMLLEANWTALLPFSISYCAIFLPSVFLTFDLIWWVIWFIMFLYCDSPSIGQLGYQDPGTLALLGVYELYDRIMYYLIALAVVVLWFGFRVMLTHTSFSANFFHGNLIEFLWTLAPAAILWAIGIPSLKLLYMLDEILDSEITVKAIGNQWYWSYEYSDYKQVINLDSFLIDDASLNPGDLRLLTVDNSLILPIFTSIRLLVTSNDVIHSFAVPSLGLKCDAIPGRLNSAGILLHRESFFYGQCSELCGILHGFMPISIQGVQPSSYISFLLNA